MALDGRRATHPFDAALYITEPDDQAEHLADAFASGEPAFVTIALGTVARARGMTETAKASGVTREALYRALSPKGDPRLSTLLGVVKALGFQLALVPIKPAHEKPTDEKPTAVKATDDPPAD